MNKFSAVFASAIFLFALMLSIFFMLGAKGAMAQQVGPATDAPLLYNFVNASYPTTGTYYSQVYNVARFDGAEMQYAISFANATTNNTTVTLQYSNNGLNWGEITLGSFVTNTNVFTTLNVFGDKWRVRVTTSNAQNPVNVYVGAVMK